MRNLSGIDEWLALAGRAAATVAGATGGNRPTPGADEPDEPPLGSQERRVSVGLLRVDHVGEVCAQALYEGHAAATTAPDLRAEYRHAAVEETDHLAWTQERIAELGGRRSLLNPLWYALSFGIGYAAAKAGPRIGLGFMRETERQVGRHLESHDRHLPPGDHRSRAIVRAMHRDELEHAHRAGELGAVELPAPVRGAMKVMAKVMTTTAYHI